MATRMLQRRGTAAEWAAQNPVLGAGELGFETDTKVIKMGDGVTPWNDLTVPYLHRSGGVMTGPLSLVAPTQSPHAVRLQDLVQYLHKNGGEMTGPLSLIEPTQPTHAVRLMDVIMNLSRLGGVMEGPLSVLAPVESSHPATKGYVDSKLSPALIEVITASRTWTKPEGATIIEVHAFGGGAGGGRQVNNSFRANGGSRVYARIRADLVPSTVPVTIGAGGAGLPWADTGAAYGQAGGDTSFGSILTARGGQLVENPNITHIGTITPIEIIPESMDLGGLGGPGINSQSGPGISGQFSALSTGGGGGASYATSHPGGNGGGPLGGAGGIATNGANGGDGGYRCGGGGVSGSGSGGRGGHGGPCGGGGGAASIYRSGSVGGNGGRGEMTVVTYF